MNSLLSVSPDSLVAKTKILVREELRIGLEVLAHLRAIDDRKIYLDRGHSSLFAFCLTELGYSETQAQLRISAMRALRDTPQIEAQVKSGALNVTAVAKVQQFLRKERMHRGVNYSAPERADLFLKVSGKSLREVEAELIKISPESAIPQERLRPLTESKTELKLVIDQELKLKFDALRAIYSHQMRDVNSVTELLEILATNALKKVEKRNAPKSDQATPAPVALQVIPTRYIPSAIRRQIVSRAGKSCEYLDPETGRRCAARHFLQIDHIKPFSQGGQSDQTENLRILCGAHNRQAWQKQMGG